MKRLYSFMLMLMVLLSCMGCGQIETHKKSLPTYIPYSELTEDYSLEDAKRDGCVVFEDLHLTSGEEHWLNFIAMTEKGEAATIRLAYYYTLDENESIAPELYEEIKDQYPALYFTDLTYDGTMYRTYYVEDGIEYKTEFPYLNHYTGEAPKGAAFSRYDCYILVEDKDVTYEALEKSMLSSNSKDFIPHKRVYINFIKE